MEHRSTDWKLSGTDCAREGLLAKSMCEPIEATLDSLRDAPITEIAEEPLRS